VKKSCGKNPLLMFIQYSVKNFTFKHKTAPVLFLEPGSVTQWPLSEIPSLLKLREYFPKQAKKPVLLQDRPIFIDTKQLCRDVCFKKADKLHFSYDSVQNISWSKSTLTERPAER